MILVDSSVWIQYLKPSSHPSSAHLEKLLLERMVEVALADIVFLEVMRGIKGDAEILKTEQLFERLAMFSLAPFSCYQRASEIGRACWENGYSVGSSVDLLLAAYSLHWNAQIFTLDKDFKKIQKVVPLRIYEY